MARILFIEPFYGGSHRSFADGLVANSRHQIDLLTLPGGEWRRRMRLGAQQLAKAVRDDTREWDAIISTDMLDLPDFLALTRPRFAGTPLLHYFHENQFTYPRLRGTKLDSWFGQINYLSALAADRVAFNSGFHRSDFLGALTTLAATPNNWLDPGAIAVIERKSSVLPVGLDLEGLTGDEATPSKPRPPLVLWNHRWEFDKSPELFVRAVVALASEGLEFRVAIAGEPGENPDPVLAGLPAALGDRLVHFGYSENAADYASLLREASIVVSTSRQEFFGVAILEAMYCGAFPIAPARLNYPALIPGSLHHRCLYDSEPGLRDLLRAAVLSPDPAPREIRESVLRYAWKVVAPEWDDAIDRLLRPAQSLPDAE